MTQAFITTSWDDGHPRDVRLAGLLAKNGIPGTFYIPVQNGEEPILDNHEILALAADFEIGGHSVTHRPLTRLSRGDKEREIHGSREHFATLGLAVESFCYPLGYYDSETIELVQQAGFVGARTTRILNRRLKDAYRAHPTAMCARRPGPSLLKQSALSADLGMCSYLARRGAYGAGWPEIAGASLDYVLMRGGVWHLWGHSWEIEEPDGWQILDRLLTYVRRRADETGAKMKTNAELFRLFADRPEDMTR